MIIDLYITGRACFQPLSPIQPLSLDSAFAFAFFSGVKTPLYKIGRAYGTWIDDL
jgi:hypothetical protein